MSDKSALTALIGYLAAWEDREGAMAAMMPHEYEPFMEGLKTLCVRHTPRTARHELSALAQPDAQAQQPVAQIGRDIAGRPILQWIDFALKHSCPVGSKLFLAPQTRREVPPGFRISMVDDRVVVICPDGASYAASESDADSLMYPNIASVVLAKLARALAPAIQQGKETK